MTDNGSHRAGVPMDPFTEVQLAEDWRKRLEAATGLPLAVVPCVEPNVGLEQGDEASSPELPEALVIACRKSPFQPRFLIRHPRLYVAVGLSPRLLIAGDKVIQNSGECATVSKLFSVSVQGLSESIRREHEQSHRQLLANHAADLYEQFHTLNSLTRMLSLRSSLHDLGRFLMETLPHSLPAEHIALVEETPGDPSSPKLIAASSQIPPSLIEELPSLVFQIEGRRQALVFCERNAGTRGNGGSVVAAAIRPEKSPRCWLIAVRSSPGSPYGSEAGLFLSTIAGLLERHLENRQLYEEKDRLQLAFIQSMIRLLDARDHDTCGHSERVAALARVLGRQIGLDPASEEKLAVAGLLHDLGKIGVPDETLHKTTRLNDEDWKRIRVHPELGEQMLREIIDDVAIRGGIRNHHERWDGKGYPDGLAGESIPLFGRILAVADSLDAMASRRRYRHSIDGREIDEIFWKGAGGQWDPHIVSAYFACRDELFRIRSEMVMDKLLPELEADVSEPGNPFECQSFRLEPNELATTE